MSERTYAIIGTGALGGYYGARLQRAGIDVHFLLRSDYAHVRRKGLVVDSINGDFALPNVQAYRRAGDMPRCDVVAVTLKSTQNHILPDVLPAVMKEDGVALVLQNGLGLEDEVADIVGPDRVMGGLAFLCSNKVGPGHIRHLDYGAISLGDFTADHRAAGITERMRRIAGDFETAGIKIMLAESLETARWHKLVWNIPYNGLCVLHKKTTDFIMANPFMRAHTELLMREVVKGAAACGHWIAPSFVRKMLDDTEKMVAYRPSMLIDYENGLPMETEAIFGNPLRAARNAGMELPAIADVYRGLKSLESQR